MTIIVKPPWYDYHGLSNVMIIYDIIDVLPIPSHTHIDFCDLCPKLHQLLYLVLNGHNWTEAVLRVLPTYDIPFQFSGVGLSLNGMNLPNNSIVTDTDIGTGTAALVCTTTYTPCCTSGNPETQWYFPNGSQVPNNMNLPYQRNRGPAAGRVNLNRNSESTITGIFRCDIPDANNVTQSLYVGIYDSGTGESCILSSG